MKKIHQILLAKEDYFLIVDWLRTPAYRQQLGIRESEELENELKKAKLVSSEELPGDVVRLNSMVRIRDEDENREMELMLVTPDKADLRQRKISMLSPIGTALIGFSKGQKIGWKVPAGWKSFRILEVYNSDGNKS